MEQPMAGTKFYKKQAKRLRRLYRKVAHVWHGSYLSAESSRSSSLLSTAW